MDETCVMCRMCYKNTRHEGHEVEYAVGEGGGKCDCGDEEVTMREQKYQNKEFNRRSVCRRHGKSN